MSYIKLHRSPETSDIMSDPTGFTLLAWIAIRADRETGEAFIGDWKHLGFKTEAMYRATKKRLSRYGLASFRGTNQGTVAKLGHMRVFDINERAESPENEGQTEQQASNVQSNRQATGKARAEQQAEMALQQGSQEELHGQNDTQSNRQATGGATGKQRLTRRQEVQEVQEIGISVDLWEEFLTNRKRLKATNTDRARASQIKILREAKVAGHCPTKMLEASIDNGWKQVYPPKTDGRRSDTFEPTTNKFSDMSL